MTTAREALAILEQELTGKQQTPAAPRRRIHRRRRKDCGRSRSIKPSEARLLARLNAGGIPRASLAIALGVSYGTLQLALGGPKRDQVAS